MLTSPPPPQIHSAPAVTASPIDRFFQLPAHGSNLKREIIGGLTTFAAMAYILAVNPMILGNTGMNAPALVTATALSAALMTAVMALMTNYPIALAPGMGLNAFFTFTLCLQKQIPWQAALGLVFYSGVFFFLLTITGFRKKLLEAIPRDFKTAITCGIGLFIAFIGLKDGGVIVSNQATFVTIGNIASPETLLVIIGLVSMAVCIARKIPGAIILNILLLTVVDLVLRGLGVIHAPVNLPASLIALPASLGPIFLHLDLGWFWSHFTYALPLVFSILFVDLFDNMGTLIGVCQRANLLDEHGNLPKIGRAFTADACAAMIGSCLGTSTVTSYIESAAGVEAGGRTGLTSLVVAGCFLLSLFFAPVILLIPAAATAPALVVIGVLMFQSAADLHLKEFSRAVPVAVAIMMMPLTFSISEGIALGLITDLGIKMGLGRWRQIKPLEYILGVLFALHYFFK
jgi:AGZA family xanthine/uracil permease-like MFS transporter